MDKVTNSVKGQRTRTKPGKTEQVAHAAAFLTCIREKFCSDPGRNIDLPQISWLLSSVGQASETVT
jgi:hypothetical protein